MTGGEAGLTVTVDRTGATYVAGRTSSPGFPTKKAIQKQHRGSVELFVTKIKK